MPPEQRKKMEEMMAKQGVKMGAGRAGGGMSVKICMTREMVERNEMPAQQGDCKTTQQSRSGNTMKMAFSLHQPAVQRRRPGDLREPGGLQHEDGR